MFLFFILYFQFPLSPSSQPLTTNTSLPPPSRNNKDFPSAVKANSEATLGEQGIFAVEALLSSSLTPVATKAVVDGVAAATGTAGTRTGTGRKGGNGNGNGNGAAKNGGKGGAGNRKNGGKGGNRRNAIANAKNRRTFMA